jgi:hypothetical protein
MILLQKSKTHFAFAADVRPALATKANGAGRSRAVGNP